MLLLQISPIILGKRKVSPWNELITSTVQFSRGDIMKHVVLHNKYRLYENGIIINIKTKRTVKHVLTPKGYFKVCLQNEESKQVNYRIHRLLAENFIPNPHNKPCVNHKDGDKQNNDLDNLEWCTDSENQQHSVKVLGNKPVMSDKCRRAQKLYYQRKATI